MLGALAIIVLVPVGVACAIAGLVKGDEPKKYGLIGLVLNVLWILVPVLTLWAMLRS